MAGEHPLRALEAWIEEARAEGLAQPASVAFVTVSPDGQPSARTVNLKRFEPEALLFTSAHCTANPRLLPAVPRVSLLDLGPSLARQVHVDGEAELADRALAAELFEERDPLHRFQTVVSRQGEPIESLEPLRDRLAHLAQVQESPPACPEDWGALRVRPRIVELWEEAPDRLHERRLFERDGEGWSLTLLSP